MKKSSFYSFFQRKKIPALAVFLLGIFLLFAILFCFLPSSNKKFEHFTSELFKQETVSSTLNLHYTLENPEKFGIPNAPVTFGSFSTDSTAYRAALENYLSFLETVEPDRLSRENQITYDILNSYFHTALDGADFLLYEEPLGPVTGLQSQLPVLLSEYQFHSKEDVETYLKLLTKLPQYYQSLSDFEKTKSEQGLFMSPDTASAVIEECLSFVSMGEENYLFSTFEERINELEDLSQKEKENYIEQNSQCVKTCVFPSYDSLSKTLETLKNTGVNKQGVCGYPDGKSYYEYVLKRDTGTSRSVEELKFLTQKQMVDDLNSMKTALTDNNTDIQNTNTSSSYTSLANTEPLNILNDLKTKSTSSFPDGPSVDIEVKYVPKTMEEYLSPAFYMVPAIDSSSKNTIYINRGQTIEGLELYTTLAHEGYPGHLYQTTYFASTNPAPIRSLFSCGGYTEGWATYTEMISYYYAPISKQEATLMQKNKSLTLGLYALADIGIHYEGWDLGKTNAFFGSFGIANAATVQEIYDLIVSDPGNYLKYYIGYLEFLELKKDFISSRQDTFTNLDFHRQILDIGPAPFAILRKYMDL